MPGLGLALSASEQQREKQQEQQKHQQVLQTDNDFPADPQKRHTLPLEL
jgi:hypothetical protein